MILHLHLFLTMDIATIKPLLRILRHLRPWIRMVASCRRETNIHILSVTRQFWSQVQFITLRAGFHHHGADGLLPGLAGYLLLFGYGLRPFEYGLHRTHVTRYGHKFSTVSAG